MSPSLPHSGSITGPAATLALNQTKFHPLLSSHGGVRREQLVTALEQAADAHLVLLLAPAGYGKTTLMGQLMERILHKGGFASWLRLDETDNDPARLMCYLYGALRGWMEAVLGPSQVQAFLTSDDWMSLLDRIGPNSQPHTLFLDEFEKLTAPPSLRVVKLLIDRLPRTVRVVISSREKPALGLERYRVRGELRELTANELRFDKQETQQFFTNRMKATVPSHVIAKIQSITEGWPAALQLTALAAQSEKELERYASNLSGSLAHIADYLAEDVLQAQSPEVRTFLLQTCGFSRLCTAACNSATGRTDSQRMLQYLERHGLFTTPLDTSHTWYRYHPLFAEFLQAQQAQSLPQEQIVATHRGAARWFARHGTAVEAVDLWLLAGDSDAAVREMASCARDLVMQAQFGTILRWLERLDENALANAGPELPLAAAWACGFAGEPQAAMRWLTQLKPALKPGRESNPLYDELMALESVLIAMGGDTRSALASGLAHWQRVSQGSRFAAGALANVISYCLMLEGDFERARTFCNEAQLCNEEIGSALGLGYALSVSGLIEAVQGNLDQALEMFSEVDKMTAMQSRQPWFETTHVKMASLGLIAAVWYEQDRLDEVDELLQRYLPLVMHQPSLDMQLFSYITYTRLKLALGDFEGALDILKRVDLNSTAGWQFARAHRVVEWERVRIDLLQGRLEQASARAELLERAQPMSGQPVGYSFVEELCGRGIESIRISIARGQPEAVLERLNSEIALAQAQGRRWRLLKLLLLRILALDAKGEQEAARAALVKALDLGWRIGARRSFAEEGKRIVALLTELPVQYLQFIDSAPDITSYWRDLRGERPAPVEVSTGRGQASFNERERTILKLLATGMGNDQVATAVFLSVNTVKWHIRRILEKLAARNRNEAVFIARQLGLIEA